MKLITRLLLGLIVAVATLFIGAAVLVNTVDLDQHKDRIQQYVFDKTGRSLEIKGRVQAQLFPRAGFSLQDVVLGGADGFVNQNFASVQQIEAHVQVLPLIVGRVLINHVHFQGLELDLQRNLEGWSNWDDLMSNTSVVATDVSNNDVLQEIEAGTPVVAALSVGQLVVSDAVVHWRDEMADREFTLTEFHLSAGEIKLTEPFQFETGFKVNGDVGVPVTELQASGLAGINLAENLYRLDSFQIDTVFSFAESAVKKDSTGKELVVAKDSATHDLVAKYAGSMVADLNAQTLDLAPLSLNIGGVPLSGELHVTEVFANPGVFGLIASEAFDAVPVLSAYGVALPGAFDPALLSDFTVSANFQRAQENFLFNDVSVGNKHVELKGNFQIANFLRAPVLTGSITSNEFNPVVWTEAFGYTPVDHNALTRAQVSAEVRQSGQLLVLNNIDLKVDDSTINGDLEVVKTDGGQFPVRFELQADKLNLDRYIPARSGSLLESFAGGPGIDVPIEKINGLDVQGEFSAAELQWSKLQFTEVTVPVKLGQGRLEGREVRATTYQGTLFATMVLDVTPDEPLLTATVNLNAFDVGPMIIALLQRDASLFGTGIVNVDLLSRGRTVPEIISRAGGALSLRLTDGGISDVNLSHELVSVLTKFRQPAQQYEGLNEGLEPGQQSGETKIDELSMSWELAHGSLYSDDLDLSASGLQLSGRGAIDLVKREVDYLLMAEIRADEESDENTESVAAINRAEAVGAILPLAIRGPARQLQNDLNVKLVDALQSALEGLGIPADQQPRDFTLLRDRLSQSYEEASQSLQERLDAARVAAAEEQNLRRERLADEGQEASSSFGTEMERETDELKNRLEKNLKKDLKKKLSTLTED